MEEIKQGSDEWKQMKLGKASASKMADIVARTKTGWGASRANYAAQIVCERLTGVFTENFTSADMLWGIENEPKARADYSFFAGKEIKQVCFVDHPVIKMSGASPDGLIEDDGLIEIKCPKTATHIETLLGAAIDKKYMLQMAWQMACTGRQWCDFVSYDPRLPLDLQMKIILVPRDDTQIRELEMQVCTFLAEIDEKMAALKALMPPDDGSKYLFAG